MTLRKLDIANSSYRITTGLYSFDQTDKPLNATQFKALLVKAKATGKRAAVLRQAYDLAKTKAGKNPSRSEVIAQVRSAITSLSNERAKGRVNDGYVDKREVGLLKNPLAESVYALLDGGTLGANSKPTAASDLAQRASIAKIDKAVKNLLPIVDAGFRKYDPNNDDDGDGLSKAMRAAANDAGLSAKGRAALLTALNGATSRGDGSGGPSAAEVKRLLTNGLSKLKDSDGADIVDLAHPTKAPVSKKDGVVTGLELDRTPAATGMTSRALLEYAASL